MNEFERKWQICAAQARQAPAVSEAPPLGVATRAAACCMTSKVSEVAQIWERLALRWLAGVAALLVVCVVVEAPHLRSAPVFQPGLENTISQLVWKL